VLGRRRRLVAAVEIKKEHLMGVAGAVHRLVALSALGQLLGVVQRLDGLRVLGGDRLLGDVAGAGVTFGFEAADLPPTVAAAAVDKGGLRGAGGEVMGWGGRGDSGGGCSGNDDDGELHDVCLRGGLGGSFSGPVVERGRWSDSKECICFVERKKETSVLVGGMGSCFIRLHPPSPQRTLRIGPFAVAVFCF
jgi:hypothetical protein